MKKDKSFIKRCNRLILSVLTFLGFLPVSAQVESQRRYNKTEGDDFLQYYSDEDEEYGFEPSVAYGCPSADFIFRGNVTDESGNAIPDVDVEVKCCDCTVALMKTDESGSFNITYTDSPWCDIKISFSKDANTLVDTTILLSDIVFEDLREDDVWYRVKYEADMQVSLGKNSDESRIFLNRPALSNTVDNGGEMFRIVNPVDNYMWFNFRNVSAADVTISDISGNALKQERVNDGTNIFVGDLKSGEYVVTAVSGGKRFSALFIKK